VDEPPAVIDAGLAVTITVGAAGSPVPIEPLADLVPPHPVKIKRQAGIKSASDEPVLKADG
jgi:hypothetical protein